MKKLVILLLTILAPNMAFAITATWSFSVSAPSNVSLDSTIFTGSQLVLTSPAWYDGTTLVGNISGCSPCTLTGGADAGKFQIATTGWHVGSPGQPGYRGPIELWSRGNVVGGTGSGPNGTFLIQINGTNFTLGDPPYTPRATVTVLSNGANINNAVSSASSGTTLVLASGGSYGCFSPKSGVDVVSGTKQNPISGQTVRATVNCGGGSVVLAGNSTVYGITFTSMGGGESGAFRMSGTTAARFINNAWDGGTAPCKGCDGGQVGICMTGGTNNEVSWNTESNFAGNDDNCAGGDTNYLNSHNALHNCVRDCEGNDSSNLNNRQYIDNFVDRYGTSCANCGTGSYIETQDPVQHYLPSSGVGIIVAGNWTSDDGCPATFCGILPYSLIGDGGTEFTRNYLANSSPGGGNEWNGFPEQHYHLHHNYFDRTRYTISPCPPCGSPNGEWGPFAGNNMPGSVIDNENELPDTQDECESDGAMPCLSVTYTAGTNIDFGVPPPFASGAGQ